MTTSRSGARSFIDRNVWAVAGLAEVINKQPRAAGLIAEHLQSCSGAISTRVLHELVCVWRSEAPALPPDIVPSVDSFEGVVKRRRPKRR